MKIKLIEMKKILEINTNWSFCRNQNKSRNIKTKKIMKINKIKIKDIKKINDMLIFDFNII